MKRLGGIDLLRGYAVLLMVVDHVAGIFIAWNLAVGPLHAVRFSVTRFAMPIFFAVAGFLWTRRGGPSARRVLLVALAGLVCGALGRKVGMGGPDVLLVYVACAAIAGVILAHPAVVAVAGVIQWTYWPVFGGTGYEIGLGAACCSLGVLCARSNMMPREPRPFEKSIALVGRYPLTIYVGHLAVLAGLRSVYG